MLQWSVSNNAISQQSLFFLVKETEFHKLQFSYYGYFCCTTTGRKAWQMIQTYMWTVSFPGFHTSIKSVPLQKLLPACGWFANSFAVSQRNICTFVLCKSKTSMNSNKEGNSGQSGSWMSHIVTSTCDLIQIKWLGILCFAWCLSHTLLRF